MLLQSFLNIERYKVSLKWKHFKDRNKIFLPSFQLLLRFLPQLLLPPCLLLVLGLDPLLLFPPPLNQALRLSIVVSGSRGNQSQISKIILSRRSWFFGRNFQNIYRVFLNFGDVQVRVVIVDNIFNLRQSLFVLIWNVSKGVTISEESSFKPSALLYNSSWFSNAELQAQVSKLTLIEKTFFIGNGNRNVNSSY